MAQARDLDDFPHDRTRYFLIGDGAGDFNVGEQSGEIVTAMKRGASAVLTARSSRGTQTKDTFSLLGATAMIEDAEARCSS